MSPSPYSSQRPGRPNDRCILRLMVSTALLLFSAGCQETSSPAGNAAGQGETGDETTTATDARAVLDRMAAAYREAKTYADVGQLTFRVVQEGKPLEEEADFSVSFERPNKLRMHVYKTIVVCDGEKQYATIDGLTGQVLEQPLPEAISMESVHDDPTLMKYVSSQIAGPSYQLSFLLQDDAIGQMFSQGYEMALDPPETIEGHECDKVRVTRDGLAMQLWVDRDSHVLRRIEFPGEMIRQAIGAGDDVSEVDLHIEFHQARFDEPIDSVAFQFEIPSDAQVVDRFRIPPIKIEDFSFTRLDGTEVTKESLAGKVVVIDFWATWCGWCFKGLPNLETVYQQYKDRDDIVFLAVSTDTPDVKDSALFAAWKEANLTIPIARDTKRFSASVFHVEGLPTTYLLGRDNHVHHVDIGYQENTVTELPRKLDVLLNGGDLNDFESAAPAAEDTSMTPIPPRDEPAALRIEPLWECVELKQPGNVLVVAESGGTSRLLVHDGWQTIVELGSDGQVLARHTLDLPQGAAVTFLRTAVDGAGHRLYLASAAAQQQVHVFDDGFSRLLSYPDTQHDGIGDAALGDLDGDGQSELVLGYRGLAGLHRVELDGTRAWRNPLENVFSLALLGPDARGASTILAADGQGAVVAVDAAGNTLQRALLENRFVRLLHADDVDADGLADLCCVTVSQPGLETTIGLSREGEEMWSYDLPPGIHSNPALEMLTSGRLLASPGRQWVLAGADGSIHLLAADGTLVDRFHYGAALNGLAVAELPSGPALIVATADAVTAWRVTSPQGT